MHEQFKGATSTKILVSITLDSSEYMLANPYFFKNFNFFNN